MAKETTLNEIGEMLSYVVEHMATKDDVATLRTEMKSDILRVEERIASIEGELKSIRRDLNQLANDIDDLVEKYKTAAGFRKEIDHALERIAAVEEHLGINKNIAA